ncbi:hypothetical protein SO802_011078 [Lithocarpus litseifolius]|uniref:Uncharacterized protein n=1 Tax=Lithocarpus litseifolius TaxID=425828 RepID=A0AAW2DLK1_9ROSI
MASLRTSRGDISGSRRAHLFVEKVEKLRVEGSKLRCGDGAKWVTQCDLNSTHG